MTVSTADPKQLRVLASLLALPAEDALDALRDMGAEYPWLATAIAELEDIGLERWQAEHTRLFVSGYPDTPCPPYESAYRQGTMGGTFAGDLSDLYLRAGLEVAGGRADYLGTLLECAAYLTDLGEDQLLLELLQDHMAHWVPRFARDLQEHAELALYRDLGVRLGLLFDDFSHE